MKKISIKHIAILFIISLLSFFVFIFRGGELISGIKDSAYWTHKNCYHRFFDRKGSFYFDRLDRSVSYKFAMLLNLSGNVDVDKVEIDGAEDSSLIEYNRKELGGDRKLNSYKIKVNIPKSDKFGEAVITIFLKTPHHRGKRYFQKNTRLINAQLIPIFTVEYFFKKFLPVIFHTVNLQCHLQTNIFQLWNQPVSYSSEPFYRTLYRYALQPVH
jgi:hypothetical protein